jgi:hypothetical protein
MMVYCGSVATALLPCPFKSDKYEDVAGTSRTFFVSVQGRLSFCVDGILASRRGDATSSSDAATDWHGK